MGIGLSYLFVHELSFADDNVLDASSVTKLFFMHGIVLVNLLTGLFRQVVQRVFVDHSGPFMLEHILWQVMFVIRNVCIIQRKVSNRFTGRKIAKDFERFEFYNHSRITEAGF